LSEPSWILELRRRLESPPPLRLAASEARRAAVLVPLYVDAGQLWTLLTRRSDELPEHRGQYAFPGGGAEVGEGAWETALRETEEEIGLAGARVVRLGELDEIETPSRYRLVPCVGAVPFPVETRANQSEIAEIFALPLLAFADLRVVEDRVVLLDGVERIIRVYHVGGRQIWGLTATVLRNLLQRLGLSSAGIESAEIDDAWVQ
jgi:8-oxo-dGTP pyrophosphatase MutT (NUDIX family)